MSAHDGPAAIACECTSDQFQRIQGTHVLASTWGRSQQGTDVLAPEVGASHPRGLPRDRSDERVDVFL